MTDKEKARDISKKFGTSCTMPPARIAEESAMEMARWKDEELIGFIFHLKFDLNYDSRFVFNALEDKIDILMERKVEETREKFDNASQDGDPERDANEPEDCIPSDSTIEKIARLVEKRALDSSPDALMEDVAYVRKHWKETKK